MRWEGGGIGKERGRVVGGGWRRGMREGGGEGGGGGGMKGESGEGRKE